MEPKLHLNRDQIARINNKRAIPLGGLKLILGFIIAAACVLAGKQAVTHLRNGLASLWAYYSAGYIALVVLAGVVYAFHSLYLVEKHGVLWGERRPFKWLWRYFDSNVRGWWLIYARCHSHNVYALALKSPTGEITWIVSFDHNRGPTGMCRSTNFLFIPLGGWGKRPFVYWGSAHDLSQMPDEYSYRDYQWKVDRVWGDSSDSTCELTRVWLTDTNGSRVRLGVWDALVFAHEVSKSDSQKWIGEHAMHFRRQRDEARQAARDLLGDLMTAERAVFATRRFVRSKQGLQVRVSLLLAIQHRLHELDQLGIRTRGSTEARDFDDALSKAQKSLDALSAPN